MSVSKLRKRKFFVYRLSLIFLNIKKVRLTFNTCTAGAVHNILSKYNKD